MSSKLMFLKGEGILVSQLNSERKSYIKRFAAVVVSMLLMGVGVGWGQLNVYHRSDGNTNNWWDNNSPWYYQTWNTNQVVPDAVYSSNQRHNVYIGHNNNTSMNINGKWFNLRKLTLESVASTARTFGGNNSTEGISITEGIYNLSSTTHTFNARIGIDASTVNIEGPLTFNSEIYANSNTVAFGGSSNIQVNSLISGQDGKLTKSGAGTLTLSGANTYTGTTTVSAGTLRLNRSGGTTIRVESNVTVQSGGTLQISSNQTLNNLTVNSGGTLIVDDGITLTVSGTATYNGKVVVNSSSFSSSATIADLEINRSGGVTLGSNITVSGTLTLTSGTLDIGSNTLTISGNSVARSSGNIDADAGTIAFTNTSALTLPTSTFSGSINNLTMNGNGGVTLSSSETVSGKLTLTNGKITTGANKTLTISSTNNDAHASPGLSGGSSSSYIVGNLLRKVSGSGSYKFPVGTSANYQEATTDFTSSNYSADLTASFTATPVSSGSLSGVSVNGTSLTGALNAGYWTISQSSGLNTPAYSITLKMTGHTNSQGNANRYAVIKNNGSGWLSQGTHTNNTQTETGGVVTAVRSALNSFSDFSIGFGGYPLPVTFTSLSGRVNGSQAHLTWNVAQEIDVDRYEVEESVNGRQFRPLTEVDAVNRSSYNAVDAQLHPGSNYYRVKAVDIDGKLTYSKIIRLDNGSSGQNILIYPNPTRGELNLTLNNLSADTYRIQVINAIGQTVFRQSLVHDGSNRSLPLNLSKLPTGIYQVQISNGTTAITQPVKIDQ